MSLVSVLEVLPWVQKVEAEKENNASKLRVYVSDIDVAKMELPRIVAECGLTLCQYKLELPTLENIFIELVGKKE